jgi:hypothetical protein
MLIVTARVWRSPNNRHDPQQAGNPTAALSGRSDCGAIVGDFVYRPEAGVARGVGSGDTTDIGAFELQPKFPWHNDAKALGVNNDTHVGAIDAVAVINYINAFGAGAVPANAGAMREPDCARGRPERPRRGRLSCPPA